MTTYHYELVLKKTDSNNEPDGSEIIPIFPVHANPEYAKFPISGIISNEFEIICMGEQLKIMILKTQQEFNIPEEKLFGLIEILLKYNLARIHKKEK